ncbi:MAG TPA: hypothetical protein VFK07_01720 [Candidatus Paceibacterota bacterium]|nr:hypothetical protein [Candidatus Paceibacterota bacterium]
MSNTILKWLIVVAVALVFMSVYLFFFGGPSFSQDKISLTIDAPTQAAVGDQVAYKVSLENTSKKSLYHLHLTFTYPDGAVIMKDGQVQTNASSQETIDVDQLDPGQSQNKEFDVFLMGDLGSVKTAKADLTYDAGDLRSPFEKTTTLSTTITSLPVSLTMVAPPNSGSGQAVSYLLDYRNQSSSDISDLSLVFNYPDGFRPTRFSPAPSSGNNTWSLGTLKAGSGNRIQIDGTLSGNQGDNKPVMVTLKRNVNGTDVNYESASATTVIASPLLNLSLVANDSSRYVSHPGDTLEYHVDYKNMSNYTLNGLTLSVHLDGNMYDFSSLNTRGGFFDSSTNTITWNSTVIPDFNDFGPNQSGEAVFTVNLKPSSGVGGSGNTFVHATGQLVTQNVPADLGNISSVATQDDVTTKITTQPTLTQVMYYRDPSFGSNGPIPPKAGTETDFIVHWTVTNPGNTLDNAKLTATLPQGVSWKNALSVGSGQPMPTFNANTSQVIWNLSTVPSGTGVTGSKYELVFEIGVKPSTTQVGQPMTILTSPKLSGTDGYTQEAIVVPADNLTTNDTVDQQGNGIVQ